MKQKQATITMTNAHGTKSIGLESQPFKRSPTKGRGQTIE
jgi:hypothetical protein